MTPRADATTTFGQSIRSSDNKIDNDLPRAGVDPRVGVDPGPGRRGQGMRRQVGLGVVVLALVLAGCGSGEESGSKSSSGSGEQGSSTAAGQGTDDSAAAQGGTGKGMIEVGELRHELTVTRCTSMAGAMGGDAESVTEPDNVEVYFELPPDDWADSKTIELLDHSGLIRVSIEDSYLEWVANPQGAEELNLPDGATASEIAVTDLVVSDDGQTMEGKATFLEVRRRTPKSNPTRIPEDDTPTETGTFSFSCPPAG
ncbi:MAG: hypothetical protein WBA45_01685 [Microthrixaceae bacterium]